jgi:hypothetical protein
MVHGFSLNIGLNSVDNTKYLGKFHALRNAENDAEFYYQIALLNHFNAKKLIGEDATSINLLDNLKELAQRLVFGDILFMSYSGHGTRVKDLNDEEEDGFDEVLVLYDRLFIDDEFQLCWSWFKEGVRIFFITDSCYNGHVMRLLPIEENLSDHIFRGIDTSLTEIDFEQNLLYYQGVKLGTYNNLIKELCSIIHIGACQDNQLADDGVATDKNGKFTLAVQKIYNNGNFKDSYKAFFDSVEKEMPPWEKPCWDVEAGQCDEAFAKSTFLQF